MKAYEPEMVPIGPYHHDKLKFKKAEELKLRYFDSLLQRKPEIQVEHYISAIEGIAKRARDCYAEPSMNLDSAEEFTDMLVLDGCFIIEVIRSPQLYERTFPARSSYRNLQRDLILLENQIPAFVLCKLFELVEGEGPEQHMSLMEHLLKFCLVFIPEIYPRVIPPASELKDANVKFHNKEYDSNTSLFDVKFECGGHLVMPILIVDDDTESLLRNLIAYEQLFPEDQPAYVVDYAILLDCLINTSKDVQIHSGKGIIQNMLGSDEAVVEIVNRLTDKVIFNSDSFMYADLFRDINVHHQKRWNRAVAAFHRDYFSTPWAYIAFMGALLLLFLTVAQTIFSALQVFDKPPHH
ncbi:hypothetical protein ACS0TY_010162 [Phlomoides rotata]